MLDIYNCKDKTRERIEAELEANQKKYEKTCRRLTRARDRRLNRMFEKVYGVKIGARNPWTIRIDMLAMEARVGIVDIELSRKMIKAGVDCAYGLDCNDGQAFRYLILHTQDGWRWMSDSVYSHSDIGMLLKMTPLTFSDAVLQANAAACTLGGVITTAQMQHRADQLAKRLARLGVRDTDKQGVEEDD